MKIKVINVISFGGLKNYSLSLEEGLNCIYGENEKGKSTLMAFIKMMFYGNDRGSSQISKNIRKKYTPWDGSPMAGSIIFSYNGKDYKLEREFKSSNSTDKVYLTDLSLGEKSAVSADIGMQLFGISASAFERSIFIGQLGFPTGDANAEAEINARLSNMVSTGDEKISLKDVASRLEKARFSIISKSGKTGEYQKNLNVANELKEKLEISTANHKRYIEGKAKLTFYSEQTDNLCKKAMALKEQISKEQDIKNTEKLIDFISTKEKLEEVKKSLILKDGSFADLNLLNSLKFSISKFEDAKMRVTSKEKETEIIRSQLNILLNGPTLSGDETPKKLGEDLLLLDKNAATLQSQINDNNVRLSSLAKDIEKKSKKKSAFNPIILIFSIFLLAAGGICFTFAKIPSVLLWALGLIFLIFSFIIKPKNSKQARLLEEEISSLQALLQNQAAHLEDIKSQIGEKKTKLEAIKLASSSNSQLIEAQRCQLEVAENELNILREEKAKEFEKLQKFLTRFDQGGDIKETIGLLEAACEKQKELKQHISFLLRDLNNITYEKAKERLAAVEKGAVETNIDFEKVKSSYEELLNEISNRRATESAVEAELKGLISQVENPRIIENSLKEKTELLEEQNEFCQSLDIALEVLNESFAELRQNYGSKLEKETAQIFSCITEGKYSDLTVSKSFEINVSEENSISRQAEYLSNGTFDQAYLSLRLAISKLLTQKESLPIFLDDALAQYDDDRAKITLSYLKDYCENSQGIIFTCHKYIERLCKNLNCNIKSI